MYGQYVTKIATGNQEGGMRLIFLLTLLVSLTQQVCLPQYDYMVRLYEQSQEESSKTKVHSFASNGQARSKTSIVFSFENDWKIPLSRTVGAVLHVISVPELQSKLLQYQIPEVGQILVNLYSRRRRGHTRLVSSTMTELSNATTITVDLTDYMVKVMSRPTYPQPKLILSLRSVSASKALPARFLMNEGCATPFLVVTTRGEETDEDLAAAVPLIGHAPYLWEAKRSKRRAKSWPTPLLYRDVTALEKINYHCRRKDLWINFHDIGWDFVITPNDVNIGDCGGRCLDADKNIPHAMVKQLLQNINPSRNAGILCCQGANYKEISALYFKSKHEIVIGSMPKMIVKECRCR